MAGNKKFAGGFCGILTGVFWALSGVLCQYLFEHTTMQSHWFVAVRMLVSGFCMMAFTLFTKKDEIRRLVHNKRDLLRCFFGGVLGTMLFQFACYGAVQRSNAATAIVLQYLCPVMVMIYVCIRNHRLPKRYEIGALIFAIAGIFLISTHGNIHELVISKEALLWGIGCAFFMMLGTILPETLYDRYSVQTITSVALFFGGIVAGVLNRPWENPPVLDFGELALLSMAILCGSIMAYVVYGIAIKKLGSVKASLFACSEIPSATILSVVFLESQFLLIDIIGFVLIGSTIFILSVRK